MFRVILLATFICCTAAADCGGTFNSTAQIQGKVVVPGNIAANTTCTWKFVRDENATVSYTMLDIRDLMLGQGDSLVVYNGPEASEPVKTFSGDTKQDFQLFITTENVTTMVFHTGNEKVGGFNGTYRMNGCTVSIGLSDVRRSMVISSPLYHVNASLSNSAMCTYTLGVPIHGKYLLSTSFSQVNVAKDGGLTIYDGEIKDDNILGRVTGSSIPHDMIGQKPVMNMKLNLPLKNNDTVMTALVEVVTAGCSGYVDGNKTRESTLMPPPSPQSQVDCRMVVEVGQNDSLATQLRPGTARFTDDFDQIIIRDGGNKLGRQLARYSNSSCLDRVVLTTSNLMWLKYVEFEREQGGGHKLGHLQWRATKTLDKTLLEEFTCKNILSSLSEAKQ